MSKKSKIQSQRFESHGFQFVAETGREPNAVHLYCESPLDEGGGWSAMRTPLGVMWRVGDKVVRTDPYSQHPVGVYASSMEVAIFSLATQFAIQNVGRKK